MSLARRLITTCLIGTLCVYSMFSAVDISLVLVCGISLACLALLVVVTGGVISISRVFLLLTIDIVLATIYSHRFEPALISYSLVFLILIMTCIVITSHPLKYDLESIIKVVVFFSIVSIVFLIAEYVFRTRIRGILSLFLSGDNLTLEMNRIQTGYGFRGLAEFPNAISIAGFFLLCYTIWMTNSRNKTKKAILYVLSIVGIVISGERTDFVFVPFSLVATYYLGSDRGKLFRALKIFAIGIATILILILLRSYLMKYYLFRRVFTSITGYFAGESISNGRSRLYSTAIMQWKRSPIIGSGWFYFFYNNRGIIGRDVYVHVHNLILEFLCDCGIIGMIMFMLPITSSLFGNVRELRKIGDNNKYTRIYKFSLALQIYFLTDSMLHVTFFSQNLIMFYFLALLFYYSTKKVANTIPTTMEGI